MVARTASSMSDMNQESLRLLIRRKLQNGRLPHDGIRRVASSPNAGETCDACDAIVAMDQLLMEGIWPGSPLKSDERDVVQAASREAPRLANASSRAPTDALAGTARANGHPASPG